MSAPATGPKITTTTIINIRSRTGRILQFKDVEGLPWHHVPADGVGRVELQLQGVSTWTSEVPLFIARAVENAGIVMVRGNTSPGTLEAFRTALIRAAERIRREGAREARAQDAVAGDLDA